MRINELKTEKDFDTVYHLDIGTITMFDTYLVAEFKEGILLDFTNYLHIAGLIEDHFKHLKSFGYISNRLCPYATVPIALLDARSYITPEARIAHVNYSEQSKKSSLFEISFVPFVSETFDNLTNALSWITQETNLVTC